MSKTTTIKSNKTGSARFVHRQASGRFVVKGARDGTFIRGDRVTLPRAEYERLLAKAGEAGELPTLPVPNAKGHVPAVEFARASIARELIRRRAEAGLSQDELAAAAGVRRETISRIESGKHSVTERIMNKIERALIKKGASPGF